MSLNMSNTENNGNMSQHEYKTGNEKQTRQVRSNKLTWVTHEEIKSKLRANMNNMSKAHANGNL